MIDKVLFRLAKQRRICRVNERAVGIVVGKRRDVQVWGCE